MTHGPRPRALALLVLVAWLLPAASAVALGVHTALDHGPHATGVHASEEALHGASGHAHDHDASGHARDHGADAAELARILRHGHSHEVGAPDHEHPLTAAPAAPSPPAPGALLDGKLGVAAPAPACQAPAVPWRRPPPRSLLDLYCISLR